MKRMNLYVMIASIAMTNIFQASQRPGGMFEKTERHTGDFSNTGEINVENNHGKTVVKGWDKNSILVQVMKKASTQALLDATTVDVHGDASRVEIRTNYPEQEMPSSIMIGNNVFQGLVGRGGSVVINGVRITGNNVNGSLSEVDYLIRVPHTASVETHSEDGFIKIKKMLNSMSAQTTNGDIEITKAQGDAVAKTMNGTAKIRGKLNSVTMNSMNGSLRISGTARNVMAQTMNGSVRAKGYFDNVSASSMNGSVDIDKAKRSQVSTMNGSKRSKVWDGTPGEKNWSDDSSDDEA